MTHSKNSMKNTEASTINIKDSFLFDTHIKMKQDKLFWISMRKRERLRAIERLEQSKNQAFDYMKAIESFLKKNKWKQFSYDYESEYNRRKYVHYNLSHLDIKRITDEDLKRLDEYYHHICSECIIDR